MNDNQAIFVKYATLLQRLCSPNYSLKLQINCDIPQDEDARMMELDGAPLRTVGKFISARCGWDGQIACWINLSDLRTTTNQVRSLTKFLQATGPCLNVLGEALVESHRENFLNFISTFEGAAWHQACLEEGICQFRIQSVPELGPHLVLSLTAHFVAVVLGAAEARKGSRFPRHAQFGRYASILLRIAQGRYPVSLSASTLKNGKPPTADWAGDGKDPEERWQGDVSAVIKQPDLGLSVSIIESCLPLFKEKGELTDWLGDALLTARFNDFEAYIAILAPDDWRFATRAYRHRHWGLILRPGEREVPYQLVFGCHVSRISQALNDRLLQAAAEGAR